MLSVKDVAIVYETLLATPGMNDTVKVSLHIPRKQVLLLSKLIEIGMEARSDEGKPTVLSAADAATLEELAALSGELLKKAGLTEMNEKINALLAK
ncbi:MAG: hypothetical protein E6Q24_15265 [Chitinophagaceae bacterium]|nr:MAG: hypothetical protein E6Q24_15265 [Chitinophagaceae bacterium]